MFMMHDTATSKTRKQRDRAFPWPCANCLKVEVYLPTAAYPVIRVGMHAEIRPQEPIGGAYVAEVASKDAQIDAASGQVKVRYTDDGKEKVVTGRFDLPPDVVNGLVLTLLKNIRSDVPQTKVSMVAATPKPRLVRLAITPQGEDLFSIGGASRKATHYVVKVEIGGAAGLVAPLLGKQPPDTHVWILGGEAPAFVKSEGPLYFGGPIWRIELVSPVWPRALAVDSKD